MEPERLNSPNTSVITIEILGNELHFAQDPNSKHLGTTVWDASMVLVKYLEKNSRKGRFCPSKLKGKRVIELGAGCGVAGFGMALLGCDVVATDQAEVLPLLRRNVERNTSRILQMNSDSFGSIQVAELDWGNMEQIKAVHPPFDFIVGTDVVYAEHLLAPLLQTIGALSGPRTTILLGYEIRSTSVHEQMLQMWKRNFDFKTITKSKMHSKYQHPSIQLYMMGLKSIENSDSGVQRADSMDETTQSMGSSDEETPRLDHNTNEDDMTEPLGDSNSGYTNAVDNPLCEKFNEDCKILPKLKNGDFSEWEARRYGSMAARLLRDIKMT